jgi:hypothetical protein
VTINGGGRGYVPIRRIITDICSMPENGGKTTVDISGNTIFITVESHDDWSVEIKQLIEEIPGAMFDHRVIPVQPIDEDDRKIRDELMKKLFDSEYTCMFGDGLERDYLYGGTVIEGYHDMTTSELLNKWKEMGGDDEEE